MMAEGIVSPRTEGTPSHGDFLRSQGRPFSPLLSNILLTELDRELERRGHAFCRYADDCNIYVRSQQAGERVMASITRFLADTLKLTVNAAKSAVAQPWKKVSGLQFDVAPSPETEDCADQPETAGRQNPRSAPRRARAQADSIAAEAALDGLYIIRTSVPANEIQAADCARNYKSLANVERAFRSLKTVDLKVRPIHHRLAGRVRSHIFLCMLAYYVEWHMREAWRELMFADPDQEAKATRDPVAPAARSEGALVKVARHTLDDDSPAHSFATLMAELACVVRNTCRTPQTAKTAPTFGILTTPNIKQQRAFELLWQITV